MTPRALKKLFRPPHKATIEAFAATLASAASPVAVLDTQDQPLWMYPANSAPTESTESTQPTSRHAITSQGELLGAVVGGPEAARLADFLSYLAEREAEKVALADETLGRYKELTLLYNMSDALSRVLDVDAVARAVVTCAQRFHRADEVTLFLLNRSRALLEPAASTGEAANVAALGLESGLESGVLHTGRAEFIALSPPQRGTLACAPLRAGEAAFGVLRVLHDQPVRWNAGDLKLLTSLASQAAAAMSNAMLHRDLLRQQVLRAQIERLVSPQLLSAALSNPNQTPDASPGALAVLLCDIGQITKSLDGTAESMVQTLLALTWDALSLLLEHGATVNAAHGEVIVALFPDPTGFESSARRAVDAAAALMQRLNPCPGIGIACAPLTHWQTDPKPFFAGVSTAATLQAAAEGRALVDESIAAAVPERVVYTSPQARSSASFNTSNPPSAAAEIQR